MNENAENTCATAASREAMEKVCRFLSMNQGGRAFSAEM